MAAASGAIRRCAKSRGVRWVSDWDSLFSKCAPAITMARRLSILVNQAPQRGPTNTLAVQCPRINPPSARIAPVRKTSKPDIVPRIAPRIAAIPPNTLQTPARSPSSIRLRLQTSARSPSSIRARLQMPARSTSGIRLRLQRSARSRRSSVCACKGLLEARRTGVCRRKRGFHLFPPPNPPPAHAPKSPRPTSEVAPHPPLRHDPPKNEHAGDPDPAIRRKRCPEGRQ